MTDRCPVCGSRMDNPVDRHEFYHQINWDRIIVDETISREYCSEECVLKSWDPDRVSAQVDLE